MQMFYYIRAGGYVFVKVRFLYRATYMVSLDQEQRALTISEVAVDWQEPTVLRPS